MDWIDGLMHDIAEYPPSCSHNVHNAVGPQLHTHAERHAFAELQPRSRGSRTDARRSHPRNFDAVLALAIDPVFSNPKEISRRTCTADGSSKTAESANALASSVNAVVPFRALPDE